MSVRLELARLADVAGFATDPPPPSFRDSSAPLSAVNVERKWTRERTVQVGKHALIVLSAPESLLLRCLLLVCSAFARRFVACVLYVHVKSFVCVWFDRSVCFHLQHASFWPCLEWSEAPLGATTAEFMWEIFLLISARKTSRTCFTNTERSEISIWKTGEVALRLPLSSLRTPGKWELSLA